MNQYCVVVAEIALARLYTLESAEFPEIESSPRLVERKHLTNPQHRAKESELWTDTERGANREHQAAQRQGQGQVTGIPHHNFDEHRENNERENNRAFAKKLVNELDQYVSRHDIRRVVLCAEKQMLGYLRPELKGNLDKVQLQEVAKDLTGLNPQALHEKLAKEGLLPKRNGRPPVG